MCGPPAVPLNAKVKTVSGDLGIYEASYECDSGYELFGPSTTKCDPKNGWEKDLPFCGKTGENKINEKSLVTNTFPIF